MENTKEIKFKPLADWVLVKKDFAEGVSKGGILMVTKAEERPTTGTAIAIGNKVEFIKVGDKINFHYAAGTTLEFEGEKLSIIKESDINGIIA